MSNRGGLRLGFGGKRTKRAAKKSEGTHLTPRKDEPLTVRCAKSLAEALSEQSDDVEEWGAVVCSWPAAALERVLPLLPARVLLRLHAAFGGISPAAHDVLGDGAVLERAIQRDEKRENGLVDVFRGDAAGAPWTAAGGPTTESSRLSMIRWMRRAVSFPTNFNASASRPLVMRAGYWLTDRAARPSAIACSEL